MRSKTASGILLVSLALAILTGCSGGDDTAKTGVKVLPGDYAHAPGGGAAPNHGGGAAASTTTGQTGS